jgi:hypothetical protein
MALKNVFFGGTFQDVTVEDVIVESSLSRMLDVMQKYQCAFISAFREFKEDESGNEILDKNGKHIALSHKENLRRHQSLKQDIKNLGYGYIEVMGKWVENGVESDESTLFVINGGKSDHKIADSYVFRWDILKLSKDYNQHSIIVSTPPPPKPREDDESNDEYDPDKERERLLSGQLTQYDKRGNTLRQANRISVDKLTQMFTSAFGHKLSFNFPSESCIYTQNFIKEPYEFTEKVVGRSWPCPIMKRRELSAKNYLEKVRREDIHEESQRKKRERYEKYIQHVINGDVKEDKK